MKAWGPAVFWAAVLFGLSSLHRIPGSTLFPHEDKVGHFFLYAVLGACVGWVHKELGPGRMPHWALIAAGWLYGALDEFHQSFVPGRDPDIHDWVVDAIGVIVGYTLFLYLSSRAARSADTGPGPAGPGGSTGTTPDQHRGP